MHTWHDREMVLDIMEEISGGRVSHAANQIGGVRFDLDEAHDEWIRGILNKLRSRVEDLLTIIDTEPAMKARTRGVAPIKADQIVKYGVVGPVARASGVDVDFRRDMPLPPYDRLDVRVVTHPDGDAWARTFVRAEETRVSLDICETILQMMPLGDVSVRAPRRVPEGEVVIRSEAPRGELLYYLRSDGSDKPARLKIRTPTLAALSLLPVQLSEINVADIPVVLAGIDLCIACADR